MKLSAKQLGKLVGLDSKEVNKKLLSLGFLDGKPGDWFITKKGLEYGEMRHKSNGYGGYAARSWGYPVWDEKIASMIGNPKAQLAKVNKSRRQWGLPLLETILDLLDT